MREEKRKRRKRERKKKMQKRSQEKRRDEQKKQVFGWRWLAEGGSREWQRERAQREERRSLSVSCVSQAAQTWAKSRHP